MAPDRGVGASRREVPPVAQKLEPDARADNDRERDAGAVVIDALQARAHQLIDFGQPADTPQSGLHVEVEPLRNRKEDPGVDAHRERRCLIVEVGGIEDECPPAARP